jgi:glycosyltransferase involved in cell wall biosynthesis
MTRHVLFLSLAPAGYLFTCIERLAQEYDVQILIVHHPLDENAPFKLRLNSEKIILINKSQITTAELKRTVHEFAPHAIFCSGWMDPDYLAICRQMKGKARQVLKFDNPWRNTLRQNVMRIAGPIYFKRIFDACWVSGSPQRQYALRMGFSDDQISEGGYSGHYDYFHQAYLKFSESKQKQFPHRFIYVGRYVPVKRIDLLWQAFIEFVQESNSDWELWCLGKGILKDQMPEHPAIRDFGFVQPEEMESFIGSTGVFILPSAMEPWGVVVHEYAAAGFPLICSHKVYSATAFLRDGYNGFLHTSGSKSSLKETLYKMVCRSDEQLVEMGRRSAALASVINPSIWASLAWQFATADAWPRFRFEEAINRLA